MYENKNDSLLHSIKTAVVMEYTDWQNLDNNNKQFSRPVDLISDQWFHILAAQTTQSHTFSSTKHTYVLSSHRSIKKRTAQQSQITVTNSNLFLPHGLTKISTLVAN